MTRKLKPWTIIIPLFFLIAAGCGKGEIPDASYDITLYAATYGQGIYKSDNGATSWYPMDIDQEDLQLYFKRIFIHPEKRELFIATTGAGLFTMDLEAETLNRITRFKDENVRAVAFLTGLSDRERGVETFAGMYERGAYRCGNNSGEWQPSNTGLIYRDVNTFLVTGGDLYAGTVKDLFKWDKGSRVWKPASEGIKNKNIISMAAHPLGGALYAGAGVYGEEKGLFENIPVLYKSTDRGQAWEPFDKGLPEDALIYVITVNPGDPQRIYAGTSDGLYRSTDSGENWKKLEHGLPEEYSVLDIKIAPIPDNIYVVYTAGTRGVFTALDGENPLWMKKSYGLPDTNITGLALTNEQLSQTGK